tara:strand:+ start:1312 stop:1638 length:327 start_codon:yes stop_codon:yes gene_type:complete
MPYKPNKQMMSDAKRAIEYNENASPSQRWGTQVGKVRAQQIAQGKALSPDVIVRMYSYLKRAESNYLAQKNSGKLGKAFFAFLGWGGPSAIAWAEDKIRKMQRAGELK